MRRSGRGIEIFSMSALDVLAMTTGAFVVMVTLLLPYYQRERDAFAQMEELHEAEAAVRAKSVSSEQKAAQTMGELADMVSEIEALGATNAALESRIAAAKRQMAKLNEQNQDAPPRQEKEGSLQNSAIEKLDVVFVIDTTSSMSPVIRDLSLSLRGIVRVLQRLVASVRIGFAAYTDRDTGYAPVRALPLTDTSKNLARVTGFAQSLKPPPRGSQTIDEDMELGLLRAIQMNWRADAAKVIVVIGDARPHRKDRTMTINLASQFRAAGPNNGVSTLFVSTPSSRSRGDIARNFFEVLARSGGGTFNDHTGQMFESIILSVVLE